MKARKKEDDPEWSECVTMEEWVERCLRDGYTAIVKNMMKALPENKKEKYREIYKRVMAEKKNDNSS